VFKRLSISPRELRATLSHGGAAAGLKLAQAKVADSPAQQAAAQHMAQLAQLGAFLEREAAWRAHPSPLQQLLHHVAASADAALIGGMRDEELASLPMHACAAAHARCAAPPAPWLLPCPRRMTAAGIASVTAMPGCCAWLQR
jgi:hypothetical protein